MNSSKLKQLKGKAWQKYQRLLDALTPLPVARWIAAALFYVLFIVRVFYIDGYYIVAYAASIHCLYLFLLMITPSGFGQDEMDNAASTGVGAAADSAEGVLPTTEEAAREAEIRPFVPQVGEFKVWRKVIFVLFLAYIASFIPIFNIPVFWPILVFYFLFLVVVQLSGRISHMIKYKYVPWNSRKNMYVAKETRAE